MATHKSAVKRHRQSAKRNERNRQARSELRSALKTALTLVEEGKFDEAKKAAKRATSLCDKAAVHGIIHKRTARRTISRLSVRLAKGSQAPAK